MKTLPEIEKLKNDLAIAWNAIRWQEAEEPTLKTIRGRESFKAGFDACLALMLEREKEIQKIVLDEIHNQARKNYEEDMETDPSDLIYVERILNQTREALEALEKLK